MIQRIILHAGTEKTGTTALQVFLESHGAELARRGFHYPPSGEDFRRTGRFPKHRWVIEALMSPAPDELAQAFEGAIAGCPEAAHTLILSDEALYGDWPHVSGAARAGLAALAARFEVEFWVWFRDPEAYARSQYVQMLKNPVGAAPGNGRNLSIDAALELPWFVSRLNYAGFVADLDQLLGPSRLRLFAYQGDTVGAFLGALGMGEIAAGHPAENRTVGAGGVAMLRTLNRFALDPEAKAAAVRLIEDLDARLGAQSAPLKLSAKTRARIRELSGSGLSFLGNRRLQTEAP